MNRFHLAIALMVAVALVIVAGPGLAGGDDVTIRTIGGDKQPGRTGQPPPAQTRPESPAATAIQPAPAWRPQSKDNTLNYYLAQLKLTDEQKAKLDEIISAANDEKGPALSEFQAKANEVGAKVNLAYQQAAGAGFKNPSTQPEVRAAMAEWDKLQSEINKARAAGRQRLLPKISAVLDDEQKAQFAEVMEETSGTPAGNARKNARYALPRLAPGVELSDDQTIKAINAIAPLMAKQEAKNNELQKQLASKFKPLFQKLLKDPDDAAAFKGLLDMSSELEANGRDPDASLAAAVDKLLTPEQRQKAAQGRREQSDQDFKRELESMADGLPQEAGLSFDEAQKKKAGELSAAALDAAAKANLDEAGRMELSKQVFTDFWNLLTAEQKKKVMSMGLQQMEQMEQSQQ